MKFNDGIGRSPPARVAWIETTSIEIESGVISVATREGGVDRNIILDPMRSSFGVATREGGVDRNVT